MSRAGFTGLRPRLMLLVLLAMLPALALGTYVVWQERQRAEETALDQALMLVRHVSWHQTHLMESGRQLLAALAVIPELRRDVAGCNRVLAGFRESHPAYASMAVTRPTGEVFCSAPASDQPVSYADRVWYRSVVEKPQFTVSEVVMGRLAGQPIIALAYPVLDPAQRLEWIVGAAVRLSTIDQDLREANVPAGTSITVVDRNATIIARHPDSDRWVGKAFPDVPIIKVVLGQAREGTATSVGLDGTSRLFAFSPLAERNIGAFVIVGIPTEVAFAKANDLFLQGLLAFGLVAALVLVATGVYSATLILRPVRTLVGAIQEMEAGNLSARSGVVRERGELGHLARAFDKMAEALQRQQDALRASEERFRLLLEGVQDYAIYMLDPEGRVASWNAGAERIKGYRAEEIIGRDFARFYTEDDRRAGKPEAALRQAQAEGRSEDEGWRVRKNGSRFWAGVFMTPLRDASGTLRGFAKVSRDLTELRQAGEALRASEARLRLQVERMPIALIVWDTDFRVVEWNSAAERIFGWSSSDAIGKRPYELIVPHSARRAVEEVWRRLLEGDETAHSVNENSRRDGRTIVCEWSNTPLRGHDGAVIGVLSMAQDITERTRQEEQLAALLEDLKRSNAELERFAYVASHDLQEPLRMVASYTQLLARRYRGKLDADADEFIAYAVDGAMRMQRLINDLLAYSRISTRGRPLETTSAEAVLEQSLVNLKVAIEESGALATHDPLPVVQADPVQLGQVFQNLLGNAIKFRGVESPRIHVWAERQERMWRFAVRDNGIGIEPDYHARVFLIFQRLHGVQEYPGTGIGLAICKRIVERHGGRMWVESQVAQGATFFFTLPAADTFESLRREGVADD